MEHTVTATELARRLSDILNRVRYQRERFVIERNGERVAVLSPTDAPAEISLQMLSDALGAFPVPDPRFADDLEAIQATQPPAEGDRWGS